MKVYLVGYYAALCLGCVVLSGIIGFVVWLIGRAGYLFQRGY